MSVTQTKQFPVLEIFGPVIQGEGPLAGQVSHFIRLGFCDYRCSWCDSMFAVEPMEVRTHAQRLDAVTIMETLSDLPGAPWVTLSGGNPAIHQLGSLVRGLQYDLGMNVAVETQGSVWRDWLTELDLLIVSPKPPSSGMASVEHELQTGIFMHTAECIPEHKRAVKIVVFDQTDLEWADEFLVRFPWKRAFLSVGTDPPEPGETLAETRRKVCDRYRWLSQQAPSLCTEVTIYPQLHVLAYGHQRGV